MFKSKGWPEIYGWMPYERQILSSFLRDSSSEPSFSLQHWKRRDVFVKAMSSTWCLYVWMPRYSLIEIWSGANLLDPRVSVSRRSGNERNNTFTLIFQDKWLSRRNRSSIGNGFWAHKDSISLKFYSMMSKLLVCWLLTFRNCYLSLMFHMALTLSKRKHSRVRSN